MWESDSMYCDSLPAYYRFSRNTRTTLGMIRDSLPDTRNSIYLLFTVYNNNELDLGISGKIKIGETIEQCGRRESVEEIGCVFDTNPSVVSIHNPNHTFLLMSTDQLTPLTSTLAHKWERRSLGRRDTCRHVTIVPFTDNPQREIRRLGLAYRPKTRPLVESSLTGFCLLDISLCSDSELDVREIKGRIPMVSWRYGIDG